MKKHQYAALITLLGFFVFSCHALTKDQISTSASGVYKNLKTLSVDPVRSNLFLETSPDFSGTWLRSISAERFNFELKNNGYTSGGSDDVKDRFGKSVADQFISTDAMVKSGKVKKIWIGYIQVIERDQGGKPTTLGVEDAIEYTFKGAEKLFLADDSGCTSLDFPGMTVLAIGIWKWHPVNGGMASSIKYAWIADPEIKKLRTVPPKTVLCRITDDRD